MTSLQAADAAPGPAPSPGGPPAAIDLAGVSKVYGRGPDAVVALDRLDLAIGEGSFVSIVGASGCGKSTLLSLVAGLDRPTAGTVKVWGGHPALIFQEAALFPWLTAGREHRARRFDCGASAGPSAGSAWQTCSNAST